MSAFSTIDIVKGEGKGEYKIKAANILLVWPVDTTET